MRFEFDEFDEVSGLSSMQLRIILIMNTFAMIDYGFKQDGVTKYFYKIWPLLAYFHLCGYSSEDWEVNMISSSPSILICPVLQIAAIDK